MPRKALKAPVSILDEKLFDSILRDLAEGVPLRRLRVKHSIQHATWKEWLALGDNETRYARAKEVAMETLGDEILDIVDDVAPISDHVAKARLQVDSRKWLMAKLAPKKYGDKVSAEVTGADGAPLMPEKAQDPREVAKALMAMLRRGVNVLPDVQPAIEDSAGDRESQ